MYRSLSDAIRVAETSHRSLSEVAIDQESRDQGRSPDEIRKSLARAMRRPARMHGSMGGSDRREHPPFGMRPGSGGDEPPQENRQ